MTYFLWYQTDLGSACWGSLLQYRPITILAANWLSHECMWKTPKLGKVHPPNYIIVICLLHEKQFHDFNLVTNRQLTKFNSLPIFCGYMLCQKSSHYSVTRLLRFLHFSAWIEVAKPNSLETLARVFTRALRNSQTFWLVQWSVNVRELIEWKIVHNFPQLMRNVSGHNKHTAYCNKWY